jgi:hypothetical protein
LDNQIKIKSRAKVLIICDPACFFSTFVQCFVNIDKKAISYASSFPISFKKKKDKNHINEM